MLVAKILMIEQESGKPTCESGGVPRVVIIKLVVEYRHVFNLNLIFYDDNGT